jgi:hypothetical protein
MEQATNQGTSQRNTSYNKSMTLEKARAIVWPFRPYRGQSMGALVDAKQLSLKDLGYAVENAWDEQVRQAAITLVLTKLNQALEEPERSAGIMHVVSAGRSYAVRRQFLLTYLQGIVGGIVLGVAIGLFITSLSSATSAPASRPINELFSSPTRILAAVIVLGLGLGITWGLLRLLDLIMNRLDKRIETYRQGAEGEERVVSVMHQTLDRNWYLFRNVNLPGRQRTDLDSVLVGPPGVWVLEIKTFTGEYKNVGEHWYYRAGNDWKPASSSPSRQAQSNAVRLSSFLRADGVQQWITPVVVWANPECPLTVENPSVAVWSLERLPDELGNIWRGEAILEAKRNQIVGKLTKLCQVKKEAQ